MIYGILSIWLSWARSSFTGQPTSKLASSKALDQALSSIILNLEMLKTTQPMCNLANHLQDLEPWIFVHNIMLVPGCAFRQYTSMSASEQLHAEVLPFETFF